MCGLVEMWNGLRRPIDKSIKSPEIFKPRCSTGEPFGQVSPFAQAARWDCALKLRAAPLPLGERKQQGYGVA